ncbi:MAG TPA: four helix bundle protein [Rhodospirillaceae bacterium]|nr:four helix bundle protein [Rhodospirillaceae bacterium]
MVQSYKDLEVWKKSVSLVTEIYAVTKGFPREEIYGLTSQIRRSAVSIPSNIAEGRAKRSTKDYIRFVNISYGSMAELETQLIIGNNLGYLNQDRLGELLEKLSEIGRMLNGLITGLEKNLPRIPNPES